MSPTVSFFDALSITAHGLGASCIVGGIGYATDSRFTYCYIVDWTKRLCRGDSDATLMTLLFLSVVFGCAR